ncbi:MAG: type III pantothenate kinase [Methylococcaceae bacterium]
MNLLLDLGNSSLKWATAEGLPLKFGKSLPNAEITPQALRDVWQDLQPEKIGISCVGKAELLSVILVVMRELWRDIPIHFATTPSQAFGVKNGYLQPEKLGVDRWLALIAVRQKTNVPVCVVDCGTAITVDVLNAAGEHQGGLICAGLTLMKTALAFNTADLPFATSPHHAELAIETEAAIYNGTLFAACGLIERIIQKLPTNTVLFLTGGDAPLIAAQLTQPLTLETNLVLQGLAITLK